MGSEPLSTITGKTNHCPAQNAVVDKAFTAQNSVHNSEGIIILKTTIHMQRFKPMRIVLPEHMPKSFLASVFAHLLLLQLL